MSYQNLQNTGLKLANQTTLAMDEIDNQVNAINEALQLLIK